MIAQECVDSVAIGPESIRPPVFAEQLDRFLYRSNLPRQHCLQGCGNEQFFVNLGLGSLKRFLQRTGDPPVFLVNLPPDRDEMHDREKSAAPIIILFNGNEIGKHSANLIGLAIEGAGGSRCMQRINLSVSQHARQRFLPAYRLQLEFFR